jgi:hypothetical protein
MDKKTKKILKNMDSKVKKNFEARMKTISGEWQDSLEYMNDLVREIYEFGMEVGEAKAKAEAKAKCGKKCRCKK